MRYYHALMTVALGVVIAVVAWVALSNRAKPTWATIEQFNAAWDQQTGTVELSLVIDKRMQCAHVRVAKFLQPLQDGDVLPGQLPVNGHLPDKIMARSLGTHSIFDRAKPRALVPPGEYALTLQALCERPPTQPPSTLPKVELPAPPMADPTVVPPSPDLLPSNKVHVRIVVPKIPVRKIIRQGTTGMWDG